MDNFKKTLWMLRYFGRFGVPYLFTAVDDDYDSGHLEFYLISGRVLDLYFSFFDGTFRFVNGADFISEVSPDNDFELGAWFCETAYYISSLYKEEA